MKKKKDIYIFTRIFIVSLAMVLLLGIVLVYLAINALKNQKYIFVIFYILSTFIIGMTSYRWIYLPYREINKVLLLFSQEYIFRDVFDMRLYFNEEIYQVMNKFREIIDTKELLEGSKKHAEYLALQNQINPHFLYNTLEGIRSEALIEGVDSVANMTEALSTFFRYTVSDVDRFVNLEDEINNVKNYYEIQEFRFGDKLELNIEYEVADIDKLLAAKIPKLTLQPFFENAIFHGVEKKIGKGILTLKISATENRIIIRVSDNGVGMDEERVRELNQKLRGAAFKYMKDDGKKGGIALLNVNSRIKLIFGDEYGVYIYSKLGSGTDAEITIPYISEE